MFGFSIEALEAKPPITADGADAAPGAEGAPNKAFHSTEAAEAGMPAAGCTSALSGTAKALASSAADGTLNALGAAKACASAAADGT
jgi:hypothetical protein